MTTPLTAGPPLDPPGGAVAHASTTVIDGGRNGRSLLVDCWYPAAMASATRSVYEVVPGAAFTAASYREAPPAPGTHPVVLFSHGRSGNRISYIMLFEALAARGFVVIAPDHPGDTLTDWVLGAAVPDDVNEMQRVADLRFVLEESLAGRLDLPPVATIDPDRVVLAGHSYGGFTALAAAAGLDEGRVRGAAGLAAFTRTMPAEVLDRISVPTLLVTGAADGTCPPATDADPAAAVLHASGLRRVDLVHAGHQACSDVGLYLDLVDQVPELPELITAYLRSLDGEVTGRPGDPWRPTVGLQHRILGAWLDEVLEREAAASPAWSAIAAEPGVVVHAPALR